MPKVIRCGFDSTGGHGEGSFSHADPTKTSNNKVFTTGISGFGGSFGSSGKINTAIAVVGDIFTTHKQGKSTHAAQKVLKGSTRVFIKGKSVVRTGDKLDCGDSLPNGSSRVFCG